MYGGRDARNAADEGERSRPTRPAPSRARSLERPPEGGDAARRTEGPGVGNQMRQRAVARRPDSRVVVGESGDRYEREAERVARRIVDGGNPEPSDGHVEADPSPERLPVIRTASSPPSLQRSDGAPPERTGARTTPTFPSLPTGPPLLSERDARLLGYAVVDGFRLDDAELTARQRAELAEGVDSVLFALDAGPPGSHVVVTGHTDATGSEAHNEELGRMRAMAVERALVEAGVPSDRVTTESAGESQPVERTEGPNPRNRRVVVRLQTPPSVGFGLELTPPNRPSTRTRFDPFDIPYEPPTPESELDRMLREGGPPPVPPGPSFDDILGRGVDGAADALSDALGFEAEWLRGGVRRAVRAGVEKGLEAGVDATLDGLDMSGEEREAVKTVIEALRRQRPGERTDPTSDTPVQRSRDSDASTVSEDPIPDPSPAVDFLSSSPGAPLPRLERAFFESRLGTAFDDVRIHTGSRADDAAAEMGATAFTTGRDIVFRDGEYRPETASGRRLLAHELVHVVQQRGAPAGRPTPGRVQRQTDEDASEAPETAEPESPVESPALRRRLFEVLDLGSEYQFEDAPPSVAPELRTGVVPVVAGPLSESDAAAAHRGLGLTPPRYAPVREYYLVYLNDGSGINLGAGSDQWLTAYLRLGVRHEPEGTGFVDSALTMEMFTPPGDLPPGAPRDASQMYSVPNQLFMGLFYGSFEYRVRESGRYDVNVLWHLGANSLGGGEAVQDFIHRLVGSPTFPWPEGVSPYLGVGGSVDADLASFDLKVVTGTLTAETDALASTHRSRATAALSLDVETARWELPWGSLRFEGSVGATGRVFVHYNDGREVAVPGAEAGLDTSLGLRAAVGRVEVGFGLTGHTRSSTDPAAQVSESTASTENYSAPLLVPEAVAPSGHFGTGGFYLTLELPF